MRGIKIPLQDFASKCRGSLWARGAYSQDTTVFAVFLVFLQDSSTPMLPLPFTFFLPKMIAKTK